MNTPIQMFEEIKQIENKLCFSPGHPNLTDSEDFEPSSFQLKKFKSSLLADKKKEFYLKLAEHAQKRKFEVEDGPKVHL